MSRRPAARGERGTSLVETLVAVVIVGVLAAVSMSAVIASIRSSSRIQEDAQGVQDVQPVMERLSRDVRSARAVDLASNASTLVLWIDSNSDYVRGSGETITWSVVGSDLQRSEGTTTVVEGRTLSGSLVLTYNPNGGTAATPAPTTNLVTAALTYDPQAGRYVSAKTLRIAVRLRNVA